MFRINFLKMTVDLSKKLVVKVLDPLNCCSDLALEWADLQQQITSIFFAQFERLMPLMDEEQDVAHVFIHLFFDDVNEKIASFNAADSSKGNFVFEWNGYYAQAIQEEAIMQETVLHEIIHALDIQVILENRAQYLASKNFMLSHRKNVQPKENILHDFSVQWAFLHLFATIRNEGVAILGAKIVNDSVSKMAFDKGLSLFANDVAHALNLCKNSLYYKRVAPETVLSTLEMFEHHTEDYADVLLYQLTFSKLPAYSSLSYAEFLALDKSEEEKLALVSTLFEFDLSDWIRALLKDGQLKNEIFHDELLNLLTAFDREIKGDSLSLNLLNHGYNSNYSAFLSLLKSCVEVKCDFQDLLLMQVNFFEQETFDDLLEDLKFLSQRIIDLRNESNAELVDLSLTYLFQKEDIIQDHAPFVGYQDDWIVLEGAYSLLCHP